MPSDRESTPYVDDILEQPAALIRQADASLPTELRGLDLARFDRIILTGMGSSDYAAIPVERELARRGLPVMRVDAGQLLDVPERITKQTLLWATSQSGRSGEVVALIERLVGARRPALVIAATNDPASPLAESADILLELHSGPEATVSTKSYLNTLAVQERALAQLAGVGDASVDDDIRRTAAELDDLLRAWPSTDALTRRAWGARNPRFAYVGVQDDAATALTGALITKEASKVPVEGFVGGAFRHGPFELAGEGLTVALFGQGRQSDLFLPALARDLVASGASVWTVGPAPYEGTVHLATPPRASRLSRLSIGAVRAQLLTLGFSRATGEVAGRFSFGSKVTATL